MSTTAIPIPQDAALDPVSGTTVPNPGTIPVDTSLLTENRAKPVTPDQHPPVSFNPAATESRRPSLNFDEIPGHVEHLAPDTHHPLWRRLHDVAAEVSPNYSQKTVNDPTYGSMSVLGEPAKFLTPEEQREHPIATGTLETVGSLGTPGNVAMLAASGGLGEMPGLAGKVLPKLVSGLFSGSMVLNAYQSVPEIKAAVDRGDQPEAERLMTHLLIDSGMAYLAGKDAAKLLPKESLALKYAREHGTTEKGAIKVKGWDDEQEFWHGTPSGDLRGGTTGLHIGTKEAATQALESRIGIRADGKPWDGTQEYGKTLLAGNKTLTKLEEPFKKSNEEKGEYDARAFRHTGYNADLPEEDHYPRFEKSTYSDGTTVDPGAKPNVMKVKITGPMRNTPAKPLTDAGANRIGKAGREGKKPFEKGAYYKNIGEDSGSISAVVPGPSHLDFSNIPGHIEHHEPQPINPQEVADLEKELGRPVRPEDVNRIRAQQATEKNISEGLAGRRGDEASNIREDHRAELEKPKLPDDVSTHAGKLGVEFRGFQEGAGKHPGLAIFQDPSSGTSVGVRRDELTPEKLQEHVDAARERLKNSPDLNFNEIPGHVEHPSSLSEEESRQKVASIRAGDLRSKNKGEASYEGPTGKLKETSLAVSGFTPEHIEFLRESTDPERVSKYIKEKPDAPIYATPSKKSPGKWVISDGGHRLLAAIDRGDSSIRALVPASSKPETASTDVYYHGAGKQFSEFSDDWKRASTTGNPTGELGTFFTKLPNEAERYVKDFHGGKGQVVEAHVKLKNPYEMSISEFNSLSTPADLKKWDWAEMKERNTALRESLKARGYDGIIVSKGRQYEETIVFDPKKSVKVQKVRPFTTKPGWMEPPKK